MVENKERLLFYQFQMSSLGVENYFCFFHRKSLSLSLSLSGTIVSCSRCAADLFGFCCQVNSSSQTERQMMSCDVLGRYDQKQMQ